MSTLTLSLTDSLKQFVDAQVAKGGFGDSNEYLLSLLEEQQMRELDEAVLPSIIEAMESGPATPMTREDWEGIRSEALEELARRAR